jgi:hypothetical protein
MIDLKPYFDAVNTTEAEVQCIASEIDVLFREETDESKIKALALKPKLDEAQAKHGQAVALYESMQKANRPNEVAKNFVPISAAASAEAAGSQPMVIKRQEYDRMSLIDRDRFIKSGGKLED